MSKIKYKQFKLIRPTECSHCDDTFIGDLRCESKCSLKGWMGAQCMNKKGHKGLHSYCGNIIGHHPLIMWK